MKKYIILLLIILPIMIQAQNLTFDQLNYYENNKLDKGNCLLWWMIFPGACGFYSQNEMNGIFFMATEIVGSFLLINNYDNKGFRTICFVALPLIKIGELLVGFENIENYNRDLLNRIKMSHSEIKLGIKIPI